MIDDFFIVDILVIISWSIITYFLIKKYEKYTIPIVFILPVVIILLAILINFKIGL